MFSLILLIAVLITGGVVLIDKLFFASRRKQAALAQFASEHGTVGATLDSDSYSDSSTHHAAQIEPQLPILVDYAKALFPVILLVFVLRSFIVEPFRIPSGSMIPTLRIGDFILVNKYRYGIRFPVLDKKLIPVSSPERGDVMVFRWPNNPSINFIKRVIGVPGDTITYSDKRLSINGEPVPFEILEPFSHMESGQRKVTKEQVQETVTDNNYTIINDNNILSRGGTHTVPEGKYFVMGDNRDYSNDSRSWGFVPEENIVGKAFFVWMSWNSEENTVRWNRLGSVIN